MQEIGYNNKRFIGVVQKERQKEEKKKKKNNVFFFFLCGKKEGNVDCWDLVSHTTLLILGRDPPKLTTMASEHMRGSTCVLLGNIK